MGRRVGRGSGGAIRRRDRAAGSLRIKRVHTPACVKDGLLRLGRQGDGGARARGRRWRRERKGKVCVWGGEYAAPLERRGKKQGGQSGGMRIESQSSTRGNQCQADAGTERVTGCAAPARLRCASTMWAGWTVAGAALAREACAQQGRLALLSARALRQAAARPCRPAWRPTRCGGACELWAGWGRCWQGCRCRLPAPGRPTACAACAPPPWLVA